MEQYNYGENTLIHTIGFNLFKLDSILKHGILSYNEAEVEGISYSRNYRGFNRDNYISAIRGIYITEDSDSSFFITNASKGISLFIENTKNIYDSEDLTFNHVDEVFVEKKIPTQNITGILLPLKYVDHRLDELSLFPIETTSYENIKNNANNIVFYLKEMDYQIDLDHYLIIMEEIKLTFKAFSKEPESLELKKDLKEAEAILLEFLSDEMHNAFCKKLNKREVTLLEAVNYVNRDNQLPIYIENIVKKSRGSSL